MKNRYACHSPMDSDGYLGKHTYMQRTHACAHVVIPQGLAVPSVDARGCRIKCRSHPAGCAFKRAARTMTRMATTTMSTTKTQRQQQRRQGQRSHVRQVITLTRRTARTMTSGGDDDSKNNDVDNIDDTLNPTSTRPRTPTTTRAVTDFPRAQPTNRR